MGQMNEELFMGLREFRAVAHLSPSGERRHRLEDDDWPPHVEIGRKILYRRAGVMEWLERQEAKQCGIKQGDLK